MSGECGRADNFPASARARARDCGSGSPEITRIDHDVREYPWAGDLPSGLPVRVVVTFASAGTLTGCASLA
jgi:hypothetical protein